MKTSRTLKAIIAMVLLVVTLFTFAGCDIILEYLGIKDVLTIEATYTGQPIEVGGTLNKEDIFVTATLLKGITTEEFSYPVANFQVGAIDTSTVGEKQVQISYTEMGNTATTTITVTVVKKPEPTSISATYNGGEIQVGGTISQSDFSVVVTYDNNTTLTVQNFTVGTVDTSTSGDKIVAITYYYTDGSTIKSLQTSVKVTVVAPPAVLTGIVASFVGETIYVGDTLTNSDFLVQEVYSDGSKVDVTNFTFDNVDTSIPGTKQVTISYTKDDVTHNAVVNVTVVPVPAVLTGITASYVGAPLQVGATLTNSDFVVQEVYSDGSKVDVTNFTFGNVDTSVPGTKQVTIFYTKDDATHNAVVNVTVISAPVTLISISATFTNTQFHVGDTLTNDDFTVIANYSDDHTSFVDDFVITSAKTFEKSGEHTVTISYTYQDVTKTCNVTVNVLPLPVTLSSITAKFTNTQFYVGDTLTNNDFDVSASFSIGDTSIVTNFAITSTKTFTTSGAKNVTLSYTHEGVTKTCSVTVNVLPLPVTLSSITAVANNSALQVGATLKNTDFIVTAHFSDGSSTAVSDFVIVSPTGSLTTTGTVEVEFSYTFNGVTRYTTVNINVLPEAQQETVNYGKYGILSKDGKSVKIADTAKVVDTTDLQIHFLQLGNQYTGDSVYIKAGETDILIDAGSRKSSAKAIGDYIDQFVTDGTLEYVIATHAHQDHIAGFVGTTTKGEEGIFKRYDCETVIDFARSDATSQISKDYKTARDNSGANHYTALECWNNNNQSERSNQAINATGARRYFKISSNVEMEILYNYYYENKASNENEYSVCIMINQYVDDLNNISNPEKEKKVNHFLFTGDLEEHGEAKLVQYNDLPEVVLFKGGHHGSYTATTEPLLNVIKPKVICICCCTGTDEYTSNNANMFPAQAMINRVAKHTDMVFATSLYNSNKSKGQMHEPLNGDITVTSNNLGVNVTASNNITLLKDTAWFKANRICPTEWK